MMITSLASSRKAEPQGGLPPSGGRPPADGAEAQSFHIDPIASLKRHWFVSLLVLFTLLGCGGFVLHKKAKPSYEAHSVVSVSPKFPRMLATDNEVELPYDSYIADQAQRVTRYDIIADAIERLPPVIRRRTGPPLPIEVQLLQNLLDVKRIGASYEMSITLTSPSPEGLAEVVNAVTDSYVEKAKSEEFYGLDARLKTLHEEQDRLQQEMNDRLTEQALLLRQLGVATISTEAGAENPYDSASDTLRKQLADARMERQAADARYESVLKGDGARGTAALDAAADEAITTDSGLSQMRSNLNARRASLVQEMNGMRPENPIYQKDREEMTSIDAQLAGVRHDAAQHLEEKLRQDMARTHKVELQLIEELARNTQAANAAAPRLQRATALAPELDRLQKAFGAVDDRIRELELESSSPGAIHVSTRALTPLGPVKSKLPLFLLALVVLSLGCALAAPIALDLLDDRIYVPRDIERVLGFHPIGLLVNADQFAQEISDEYHLRLAAGIDHAVRSSGARTFLFTSPAHGSGTTAVIRKLSEDLKSLNLRPRSVEASEFDEAMVTRAPTPFMSGHLLARQNKTEEMYSTALLPLGAIYDWCVDDTERQRQEPSRIPAGERINQPGDSCDLVLIDANPLPISANTEYLARLADVTILVVESGVTTRPELDRAARLLERLNVPGVAIVLNKVNRSRADRALKQELKRYEQSIRRRHRANLQQSRMQT